MKHVAFSVDKETKMAVLYGTGNSTFDLDINMVSFVNQEARKDLEESVANFIKTHGYFSEAYALNKATGLGLTYKSDVFVSNFWHKNTDSGYLGVAQSITNFCIDFCLFEKRMDAIKDAQAFFKAMEKDDDLDISVCAPVNCSSISNNKISFPNTIITISDNRTRIKDASITNCLYFGQKCITNTEDFSHWRSDNFADKNTGVLIGGMDNFADAWEDTIKPLVLEEIERQCDRNAEEEELNLD